MDQRNTTLASNIPLVERMIILFVMIKELVRNESIAGSLTVDLAPSIQQQDANEKCELQPL
jgi:hypothetical protein